MKQTGVLILENLRSVENTASIFRTADGFGVSKIILIGTTPAPLDRFGRKRRDFAKVALGAEQTIHWEYQKEIGPVIDNLKEDGFTVIALEQTSHSVDLKRLAKPDKFAIVVGNEVTGVSREAIGMSDVIAEIPMFGQKESLNVSVAAGVALFVLSWIRQASSTKLTINHHK
ncbi:MAG: TrmH family RNA methyltransferase [Candidatus Zambryskibacteria bacterium]|nr:TrmH family RNA methyltransferase [Candidatus Zambryskibacteria bacterium]